MGKISQLFRDKILSNRRCSNWKAITNTTDCLLFPNSQICNEAKNGFSLSNPLEEVIFVRDTSFWNSRNQGLLITEAGIYCCWTRRGLRRRRG